MTTEKERLAIRYVTDNLTADELATVEEILVTDAEFRNKVADLKRAYQQAEGMHLAFDHERGMKFLQDGIASPKGQKRQLIFLRVAAAILLLLGGSWFFWSRQQKTAVQFIEYRAQSGDNNTPIELPDGSKVYLNGGTTIRYPLTFERSRRDVYVDGDAFFDVVPDAQRPFEVATPDLTTQVLGTSFRIRRDDEHERTEVWVATGRVAVRHGQQQLSELSPGQGIRFDARKLSYQRIDKVIEAIEGLKNKSLLFDETPLPEVCVELQRWFGVQIRCADQTVTDNLISGEFREAPLEEVLTSIAMSSNLRYRKVADIIYFENKK